MHKCLRSVLFSIVCIVSIFASEQEKVDSAMQIWQDVLQKAYPQQAGQYTVDDVDKFMVGKYKDKAYWVTGGTGNRIYFYRVDDYFDLTYATDRNGKLGTKPRIILAKKWIRAPVDPGLLLYNPE